jgi:two-component system sensor histidine kinase SenX3
MALEIDIATDLPPVRMCEVFFVDALDRLLDNAFRFSRDRGKRVRVSVQTSGGRVEIAVQDEGIGIAANQVPYLFERFRQIDREQMEQQGTGLGLAIAHELIALHEGEIVVTSQIGAGSTFTIRLPAAE